MFSTAATLFAIEMLLFGWVETKRLMDLRNPGSQVIKFIMFM